MKTFLTKLATGRAWLLPLILLLYSAYANAQGSDKYFRTMGVSDKGYWSLRTNYITQRTTVQFFNQNEELIYEETLPGKYIKLTPRTVNSLNEMFAKMVDNKLVAQTVKVNDLPTSEPLPLLASRNPSPTGEGLSETGTEEDASGFQVNIVPLINSGRVVVVFRNPDREKIRIELRNQANEVIYKEDSNKPFYRRPFNFSSAIAGTYTFAVLGKNHQHTRQFALAYPKPTIQFEQPTEARPKSFITQKRIK